MPITTKPKVIRPVRPNAGLRADYKERLDCLISEMQDSVIYWLTAQYRKDPPTIAQDATPAQMMSRALKAIVKRWQKRFDEAAPKIAEAYLKGAFKATDSAMRQALKDAGLSVQFQLTPAMRDAFEASLAENVSLIKSIPAQYLQQVEGAVMRSFTVGRDLQQMVSDVKKLYPAVSNRAVLIARDQNNKATAVVTRTRQLELGITEAIWTHSNGGKTPRKSHVAANGKRYKIAEGCEIDGVYIFPGQLINCRCVSRSVLPVSLPTSA